MTCKLLLVGCGNMGGAMLSGWLEAGLVGEAVVIKPTPLALVHPVVHVFTPQQGVPGDFVPDMIVLGVKPQMLGEVLPAYRHYAGTVPFLSLAAGKTLAWFERQLGPETAVIRSMPNLPATVRKGVTAYVANPNVTQEQEETAVALLRAVGLVRKVAESEMDAITALSANGAAYVFLLQEVMQDAAVKLGLSPELAGTFARQTIVGAGEILASSTEDAATLRARVTSKGGTTEAAVKILLHEDALFELFAAAFEAGAKRARELAV